MKRLKIFGMIVFAWAGLSCLEAADNMVGIATFVKGKVLLQRATQSVELAPDQEIWPDDVIEVGPQSKARIVFECEAIRGLKLIPAETRFSVAAFLAQKPEERGISELAVELALVISMKDTPGTALAGTRKILEGFGAFEKFVVFPTEKVLGPVAEILWLPIPEATSYQVVFDSPAKTLRTDQPRLNKDLPAFKPGEMISFTVKALKGEEVLATEEVAFLLKTPDAKDEALSVTLADLEKTQTDPDDPTMHLLKEAEYLRAGYPGNALLETVQYAKKIARPEHTSRRLRQALLRCRFSPADLRGLKIQALIPE
jgi:hypothetical protein